MTAKARRVDYSPDEYLAGIAGKLTPDEQGVYWLICTLIYSRGGPIEDDAEWLSRFFARTRARHVRKVVEHLVELGKISRQYDGSTALLTQQRAVTELLVTAQRIDTARLAGAKGGRPSKEINGLEKGRVFPSVNPTEKPTITTTTNINDDRSSSVGNSTPRVRDALEVRLEGELRDNLKERAPPADADFEPIRELLKAGYHPVKDIIRGCRMVAEHTTERVSSWQYYAVGIRHRSSPRPDHAGTVN